MRNNLLKKRHGSQGMTLVELLLVMAILSVIMMAVMSLYIPIQQSSVVQTEVSDVQSNLRLALKTMTRDLLIAGFLAPYDPIAFPDATFESGGDFHDVALASPGTSADYPKEFIIRTRAVGSGFARIALVNNSIPGVYVLTVTDPDMAENFTAGSKVRIFEPISSDEVTKGLGSSDADRAFTVQTPVSPGTVTINRGLIALSSGIPKESVMIRIKDENEPALQTIHYRLNNGALERIVNEDVHILARNVDVANSSFAYWPTPEGRINRVDIVLTGTTRELKNNAVSSAKSRAIQTTVKLRNIN